MRTPTASVSIATLALLLSFQETCRAQVVADQQQQIQVANRRYTIETEHTLAQQAGSSTRSRRTPSRLQKRQSSSRDRDADFSSSSRTRPTRASSTREDEDDDDTTAASNEADALTIAAGRASLPTESIDLSSIARSHPGAPDTVSASQVTGSDARNRASSSSTSSSASSTTSSSTSESTSSSTSSESSATPTTSSTSTSSISSSSSEGPSTVIETTTMSTSESETTATDTSANSNNVWAAYKKSSKWFPLAIIITVVISIAILVGLVAILQCIARHPRFRKQSDGSPLIPRNSSWDAASDDGHAGGSEAGGGGGYRSEMSSRRGSLLDSRSMRGVSFYADNGAQQKRTSVESNGLAKMSSLNQSTATLAKEDFLPHAGMDDYDYSSSNPTSARPGAYNPADVYPALPKFYTASPASMYAQQHSYTANGRGRQASLPSIPVHTPSTHNIPNRASFSTTLPAISRPSPAVRPHNSPAPPMSQVQYGAAGAGLARGPSFLFKPRPGPTEQQSGHRASLNGRGLPSLAPLPAGVAERRRWERCST